MKPKHTHQFVETYDGLVGYGLDRDTNENTVKIYMQKISDDALLNALIPRLDDAALEALFLTLSDLMKKHLNENEYHRLFLRDEQ